MIRRALLTACLACPLVVVAATSAGQQASSQELLRPVQIEQQLGAVEPQLRSDRHRGTADRRFASCSSKKRRQRTCS